MALPKIFGRILPQISIYNKQKIKTLISPRPIQNLAVKVLERNYTEANCKPPAPPPPPPAVKGCMLKCQVAIITGATAGIGLEVTREILAQGARAVVMVDIVEDKDILCCLRKTFGEDKVIFHKADVAKKEEFEAVFIATKIKFGRLDIVVNNAGILADGSWERTICVNIYGSVLGTYLGLNYMGTHNCCGNGGTIINVSGLLGGITPMMCSPVYAGGKHFIMGFTRALGHDFYKNTNVRMMAIFPGFTITDLSDPVKMAAKAGYKDFGNAGGIYAKGTKDLPKQNPEAVGCCVMKMLKNGKHGDLFSIEHCNCEQICFPDWRTLRYPPKIVKARPRFTEPGSSEDPPLTETCKDPPKIDPCSCEPKKSPCDPDPPKPPPPPPLPKKEPLKAKPPPKKADKPNEDCCCKRTKKRTDDPCNPKKDCCKKKDDSCNPCDKK